MASPIDRNVRLFPTGLIPTGWIRHFPPHPPLFPMTVHSTGWAKSGVVGASDVQLPVPDASDVSDASVAASEAMHDTDIGVTSMA